MVRPGRAAAAVPGPGQPPATRAGARAPPGSLAPHRVRLGRGKRDPVLRISPASPICVVDPASMEYLGTYGCPDRPRKPNPPRQFPDSGNCRVWLPLGGRGRDGLQGYRDADVDVLAVDDLGGVVVAVDRHRNGAVDAPRGVTEDVFG